MHIKIERTLLENPGWKAKDIAKELKLNKKEINSFLYENINFFKVDQEYCWTLKKLKFHIEFTSDCWIGCSKFEKALSKLESPLDSNAETVVFLIPKGCNLLLEAVARLMALVNQLVYRNKNVILDFTKCSTTLHYLNRMGFFEHISKDITVLPRRPKTSTAEVYKGNSEKVIEFGVINILEPDDSIPVDLKKRFVVLAGEKYSAAAGTILSELFWNVSEHSESPLPGFVALQHYAQSKIPHIQTVISDSGNGIVGPLKLILDKRYPLVAKEMESSEMSSDVFLLKKIFLDGHISKTKIKGRGLGISSSNSQAAKFDANISVRQETFEVKFIYKNGELFKFWYELDKSRILGTHICFDFFLDETQQLSLN